MAYTSLSTLPAAPSRFATPADFELQVDAHLIAQATLVAQLNALIAQLNAGSAGILMSTATFAMNLTALAALTATAFDVTVPGALVTDTIVVTPVEWSTNTAHRARIDHSAYWVSAGVVRVIVKNNDATAAVLTPGTWTVAILRTP